MASYDFRLRCAIFAGGFLLSIVSPAEAQLRMRSKSAKGRVTKMAPGVLEVRDEETGDFWMLKPVGPDIRYTATATPDWLAPRMLVRVTTEFDRRGNGQRPVESVQVFTPRPEYQMGVFHESGEATRSREAIQTLMVAGAIVRREGSSIRIDAGKKSFMFELAKEAEIEVDLLGDLNWVRLGDEVDFKARYYQPGRGLATKLIVYAREPLSAAAFDNQQPAGPSRRGKQDATNEKENGSPPQEPPVFDPRDEGDAS